MKVLNIHHHRLLHVQVDLESPIQVIVKMEYAVFRTGSLVEDDKLIIELQLCLKP